MSLKDNLRKRPKLKKFIHKLLMHPVKTRPQWWIRLWQPFYLKRGKKSVIYRSVRKDLVPFNPFYLGAYSVIEDYSCVNNAVGAIHIGHHTRIGLHATLIGPVNIGNYVTIAQGVVIAGLDHQYSDPETPIVSQGVTTSLICIEDGAQVGANSYISAGITIGKHSMIGAGSIVTRDIPPYSLAVGVPARVIKQYDFKKKEWVKA